jgi:hypothetical protein
MGGRWVCEAYTAANGRMTLELGHTK